MMEDSYYRSLQYNDYDLEPHIPDVTYLEMQYSKKLILNNGQRIFGPIPGGYEDLCLRPPRGCEIFVGHISYKVYEDVLFPLFSKAGKIYEMRLMMQFSGFSRGFCFVIYNDPEAVNIAIKEFHGYKIDGESICVYKSLDNCRLYISGIPEHLKKDDILRELGKVFKGVKNIFIKHYDDGTNMGYAFVDFETHRKAAQARRQMWPDKLFLWNRSLHIEWARPNKPKYLREQMKLIILGLPSEQNRIQFTEFIGSKVTLETITNTFKTEGHTFGYIEFSTMKYATKALDLLNGATCQGKFISAQKVQVNTTKETANEDFPNEMADEDFPNEMAYEDFPNEMANDDFPNEMADDDFPNEMADEGFSIENYIQVENDSSDDDEPEWWSSIPVECPLGKTKVDEPQSSENALEKNYLKSKGFSNLTCSTSLPKPENNGNIHSYFYEEKNITIPTSRCHLVYPHSLIDPCLGELGYNDLISRLVYLVNKEDEDDIDHLLNTEIHEVGRSSCQN